MKISPDRHIAPIKASADCRFIFLRFPLSKNARKRIIILSEHNHITKVLISRRLLNSVRSNDLLEITYSMFCIFFLLKILFRIFMK